MFPTPFSAPHSPVPETQFSPDFPRDFALWLLSQSVCCYSCYANWQIPYCCSAEYGENLATLITTKLIFLPHGEWYPIPSDSRWKPTTSVNIYVCTRCTHAYMYILIYLLYMYFYVCSLETKTSENILK